MARTATKSSGDRLTSALWNGHVADYNSQTDTADQAIASHLNFAAAKRPKFDFTYFNPATAPASIEGHLYYNSTDQNLKLYDGTNWVDIPGVAGGGGTYKLSPYYTVYKSGSTYYAMDAEGNVDYSGTTFPTVLNNAMTACTAAGGGRVHLKDGTFTWAAIASGQISITANIELTGEGYGTLIQIPTDVAGGDGALVPATVAGAGTSNVKIRNIRFDGQGVSQANVSNICFFRGIHDWVIEDCWFFNAKQHALRIVGETYACDGVHLRGNYSYNTGYNFCVLNGTSNFSIVGNYVELADTGIAVYGAYRGVIANNVLYDMSCAVAGLSNFGCIEIGGQVGGPGDTTYVACVGNSMDEANNGIAVHHANHVTVTANTITRCNNAGGHGNAGIVVRSTADHVVISANTIYDIDTGINIEGSSYNHVIGNYIEQSWSEAAFQKPGISLTGTRNVVRGNWVIDCGDGTNLSWGIEINANYNIVDGNYVWDTDGLHHSIGIWVKAGGDYSKVRGNHIYNANTGITLTAGGNNCVVLDNSFENGTFLAAATADAGGDATHTVDAERTEADDYWNGYYIKYITGDNKGETKLISDFDDATDTITHAAFSNATVAGDQYIILTSLATAINNAATNTELRRNQIDQTITTAYSGAGTGATFDKIVISNFSDDTDPNVTQTQFGTHSFMRHTDGVDSDLAWNFRVPDDFHQLISAYVIVVTSQTGNIRWLFGTNWGIVGEAYADTSDSAGPTDSACTQNLFTALDVTAAFNALGGIASGDYVGCNFQRQGSHANDTINDVTYTCHFLFNYV